MTDVIWAEVLKYLIPSLLTFIIGFLVNQYRSFKGYTQVIKWVCRRLIIEDCKYFIEQGFMTPKESAELEKLWDIYHKRLKGNTEGEAFYKLAKQLPVKLEDNKDEGK